MQETNTIGEGDPLVILVVKGWRRKKYYIRPSRGATYPTFAGVLLGDEIIGKPWGYAGKMGEASYYLLKPIGSELVESFGSRRSQVIYSKDSSYIVYRSGIGSGSRVFEAGVGSGFLTIAIARMVCPNGMIYGIDNRPEMIRIARKNIEMAGVSKCVSLRVGDVREGVGVSDLDAGFLDMPDPWLAFNAAYESLKNSAPLIIFIPTINQLARIVEEAGKTRRFAIYEISEILRREWEPVLGAVKPAPRMIGHTGFIIVLRRIEL